MAKKNSTPEVVETSTDESTLTPEAIDQPITGESAEVAAELPTPKEVKPLDEKTQKVRDANAALREQFRESPRLDITSKAQHASFSGIDQLEQRFLNKVVVDDTTGNWIWMGATDYDGYPVYIDNNGKRWMAARYAYQTVTGEEVTKGSQLRHNTKLHLDVNPANMTLMVPTVKPAAEQAEAAAETTESAS